MLRRLAVLLGALALVVVAAPSLWAADAAAGGASAWPSTGQFTRGSGFYLSWWKLLAVWLIFLCWVRTTDWVSQDTQEMKLAWNRWNCAVFFSFFVGLLLLFLIPIFAVGSIFLLLAYLVPLGIYIRHRNQLVTSSYDKVLSPKHTRRWVARKAALIGIKMEGADIDPRDLGPDIQFTAAGGATDRDNSANQLMARQSPGFLPAKELLDDALKQRGTHVMLDYTQTGVGVRYQIDGVWHDRSSLERAIGDPILEVFKGLAALKIADRRSRQGGQFQVQAGKNKLGCKINSQGTQTGERALLQFEAKKLPFSSLEDLGMRAKTQEQLEALLGQNGMFVFCSMPSGGLTTTMDQVFSQIDRYTRNFVEVINREKPERDIENIHPTEFNPSAGETPATVLPKLIRTYPDVIIVRDVSDLDTLSILCEQATENRLTITSIRAKEAVEALLRLMMLKIPPAEFIPVINGVLNVRLVRKLCEKCKEAYPPPAELLKQMGLPAGKIESLYRTPTQPIDPKHPEKVCDQCNGIGYIGRTGIFELLTIDETIRNVLSTSPKLDKLRLAARKAKQRSLQEEGVLLVARGVTSIQELLRVLKQ